MSEEFPKLLADEDRGRRSGIAPGYFAIGNTKISMSVAAYLLEEALTGLS